MTQGNTMSVSEMDVDSSEIGLRFQIQIGKWVIFPHFRLIRFLHIVMFAFTELRLIGLHLFEHTCW